MKQVKIRVSTPVGEEDEVAAIIDRAMRANGWSPVDRSRPYPNRPRGRRGRREVRLYLTFVR